MSTAPSDINRRRSVSSRVPPHNADAEESLLGALLLSPVVVQQATEAHLEPGDFYKASHQTIAAAVLSLYGQNVLADAVSVADELRRAGVLDDCGGMKALLELQASTPAISNAMRYQKIVAETAVLRRLIMQTSRIQESAYSEGVDALSVVAEARDLLTDQALLMPPTVGIQGLVYDWDEVQPNMDRDIAQPWVHRGIMRRGQRVAVNAGGGSGKSTLLRQAAWCAENGVHFMTGGEAGCAEFRALIVEAESGTWDAKSSMTTMRNKLAHLLGVGTPHVNRPVTLHRPGGFDLRDRRNRADLEAVLRDVKPGLMCIGPLKYLYQIQGGENYEQAALQLQVILNDLIGRFDAALMVETHSNSVDLSSTGGSQRWRDWPDCGLTLKWHEEKGDVFNAKGRIAYDVTMFRAPRDSDMIWPRRMIRDPQAVLPWMCDDQQLTGPNSSYHYVTPYLRARAAALPLLDGGEDF